MDQNIELQLQYPKMGINDEQTDLRISINETIIRSPTASGELKIEHGQIILELTKNRKYKMFY